LKATRGHGHGLSSPGETGRPLRPTLSNSPLKETRGSRPRKRSLSGTFLSSPVVEKEFATNFAGPFKGAAIKINVGAIETVGPDIAVNEGTYEVSGVMGPDGKPAPAIKGSYLNTIVKKGGAWKIAGNAALLPPAPMK